MAQHQHPTQNLAEDLGKRRVISIAPEPGTAFGEGVRSMLDELMARHNRGELVSISVSATDTNGNSLVGFVKKEKDSTLKDNIG